MDFLCTFVEIKILETLVKFSPRARRPLTLCGLTLRLRFAVLLCTLLFAAGHGRLQAQNAAPALADSLEACLITCSPGDEIYELYGHTAIRIRQLPMGDDWVFNYGLFSFDTPGFVWRFACGRTDYYLGACTYGDFIRQYLDRGSSVTEQVLNLTQDEAKALLRSLVSTAMLEDWTYRYNYFYDNCTTRARDEIEKAVNGTVCYPDSAAAGESFRDVVHAYTGGHPWSEFGQDLLLGAAADRPIGPRAQQFAPLRMKAFAEGAYILQPDGTRRPLVRHTFVLPAQKVQLGTFSFESVTPGPTALMLAALVLVLLAAWQEWRKKKVFLWLEYLLSALQGLAGCLILFMVCCSTHPTVQGNWLVWWLNPLPLLVLPLRIWARRKKRRDVYPLPAAVVLGAFLLLSPVIPQYFSTGMLVLALTLLVQECACMAIDLKQRTHG